MDVFYKRNEELANLVDAFDEDDGPLYKKIKMSHLGFDAGESTRHIQEIADRKTLLREDGTIEIVKDEDVHNEYKKAFGKNYYDEKLARDAILQKNPDYRWVTVLAGAMGRSAQELYEEEDIERKKSEIKWNDLRLKLEYERMVLPTEKKKEQLLFLRDERNALGRTLVEKESDVAFTDLNNNAETLINDALSSNRRTIFDLYLARLDFKILSEMTDTQLKADDLELAHVRRVIGLQPNDVIDDIARQRYRFITLYKYLLDESPQGKHVYYLCERILENMASVKSSFKIDGALPSNPFKKPSELKTIDMTLFDVMFPSHTIKFKSDLWKKGLTLASEKSEKKYYIVVEQFLLTKENINNVKNIPELKEITKKYNNNDELVAFLESHFIWVAFNNIINEKTEIDNYAKEVASSSKTLKIAHISRTFDELKTFISSEFDTPTPKVNAYLSRYFYEMYLLLTSQQQQQQPIVGPTNNNTTTTTTTTTGNTIKKIVTIPTPPAPTPSQPPRFSVFQFPPYMMNAFTIDEFNTQNAALIDKDVKEFIVYEPFKVYYEARPTTLHPYIKAKYPIFELEAMYTSYTTFAANERSEIGKRINEIDKTMKTIEDKIAAIAAESGDFSFLKNQALPFVTQPRTFNSQTIINGVIRLKAEVVTFMMKAWTRVQQYCPSLKGLPMQQFQEDSAFAAGLTVEFATFVAALIAENQLTFPNAYKSLAMQRHVISHCAQVMNQMKQYTYETRDGRYEIKKKSLANRSRHGMMIF